LAETPLLATELFSQNDEVCLTDHKIELGKEICKSDYINRINYANFENKALTVIFRHKIFGRSLTLLGLPKPYMANNLDLIWTNSVPENEDLSQFICERILIPSFGKYLAFYPEDYHIGSDGIALTLPEIAYELINRKKIRETAGSVEATIIQNGTQFTGFLKNFHSQGFLVCFNKENNSQFKLLNKEENISLILKKDGSMLFSGTCLISKFRDCNGFKEYVVEPVSSSFKRFKGKEYRGERYQLKSPLQVSFTHPLSNSNKQLKINDLSGSGLSLIENESKAVLFTGLVIPDLKILLPGRNFLSCRAQVIYSRKSEDESSEEVFSGLVILDMDPNEYSKLLDFVHHELDDRANVCNEVDMNSLWSFFFESGFIYPQKYKYLLNNKEEIKKLYEKLYTEQPAIAKHFIYQEENQIQGHMSMLRSYEKSWLLHHHAASSIKGQNCGLNVLNQVGSFTNNCNHIESMHLNYLFCYFRRENRFPNRMFGGLADGINDKNKCSLDDWGYFHIQRDNPTVKADLGDNWECNESTEGELRDLQCFYQMNSGGLMLNTFNLTDGSIDSTSLLRDYSKSGFSRSIELYTLKCNNDICAIIMIDNTDAGLNMSDLTNSFKIFIINPDKLDRNILERALLSLSHTYSDNSEVSALVFPVEQAKNLGLPIDKVYTMWVLNVDAGDLYFHHLKKLIRKIHH